MEVFQKRWPTGGSRRPSNAAQVCENSDYKVPLSSIQTNNLSQFIELFNNWRCRPQNENVAVLRTCLRSRKDCLGARPGRVDVSDAPHGLVPMQAAGASTSPISLRPAKTAAQPLGDREHVLILQPSCFQETAQEVGEVQCRRRQGVISACEQSYNSAHFRFDK